MSKPIFGRQRSPELRAHLSAAHRARLGAPEGMATVRGVHVPYEYRDALAFWGDWIAHHFGPDNAFAFVEKEKAEGWQNMPRITELFEQRLQVREARRAIRKFRTEVYCVENQNRR